jgi:hypothetical protein
VNTLFSNRIDYAVEVGPSLSTPMVNEQAINLYQRWLRVWHPQQEALGVVDNFKLGVRFKPQALTNLFGHDNSARFIDGNYHTI